MICHNFVIQYFESTSLYLSVLRDGLTCWNPYTGIFKPFGMFDAYANPFIYSQPATTKPGSRYFSASNHRTYTPTPLPSFFIVLTPLLLVIAKNCFSNTIANRKVKLYPHVLPKMQPCTHKNKQWPSLSSVAKAILSRQPGLIFNLVDFL